MKQLLTNDHIKQIAREYARKKGATELGKELGVSKQRINQIVHKLRKNGVCIPRMKILESNFRTIVAELRKENPELFKEGGESGKTK